MTTEMTIDADRIKKLRELCASSAIVSPVERRDLRALLNAYDHGAELLHHVANSLTGWGEPVDSHLNEWRATQIPNIERKT